MSLKTVYNNSDDEQFVQRCGEVFMITGRNMVFHCTLCDKRYTGFGEYAGHLDEHFPKPCTDAIEELQIKHEMLCDSNASPKDDVLEETKIIIPSSPDLIKLNDEDMSSASNESSTATPKNKHALKKLRRVLKCSVCTATCKNNSTLRKHIKRHEMKKSHQCPECPKQFYTSLDVKKHLRLHNDERRRFLCTICGKFCPSNFRLKDHMLRHTDQRNYKCSSCEKTFYNRRLLAQHVKVHSNERHHKCNVCEASFTFRKGLLNHMKLHENKRDYKCDLCSASFNQQAGLFGHIKTKHKTT